MSTIKPFIVSELPATYEPSGLYFVAHPLDPTQMTIYMATKLGDGVRVIYTTSPMANMQPALFDEIGVTLVSGSITSKKFYLETIQVGELTFHYNTGGDLINKKFYLGSTFIGKITYNYTSGEFTGSIYSTIE